MFRSSKLIFSIILLLGIVLLAAASREELVSAQSLTPIPTIDRLAKPTIPPNPSQADLGSQDYWLYCSPCHGDQGQGLTDEFRRQYPPEDQNCWLSGCHGERPYPNGWTIPTPVPALIGPGALQKFGNGAVLWAYIKARMPFQRPASLDDETYWRLTAFLLRQNGNWPGEGILNQQTAERVRIALGEPAATQPTPTAVDSPESFPVRLVAAAALLVLAAFFLFFILRENRRNR